MSNPTSNSVHNSWPLCNEKLSVTAYKFEAMTADEADAMPVELGLGTPRAVFEVVRDTLSILSAFAWGEEARLSRNKSSQLCELMNIG